MFKKIERHAECELWSVIEFLTAWDVKVAEIHQCMIECWENGLDTW